MERPIERASLGNEHLVSMGHQRRLYLFTANRYVDTRVIVHEQPVDYILHESATLPWFGGEDTDFVRENPGKGRILAVNDGETIYQRIINEAVPRHRKRAERSVRFAIHSLCTALNIDATPHLEQNKARIEFGLR